jgi:hypothetical protein
MQDIGHLTYLGHDRSSAHTYHKTDKIPAAPATGLHGSPEAGPHCSGKQAIRNALRPPARLRRIRQPPPRQGRESAFAEVT